MKIRTTVRTERSGEIYLTEHDLAVFISDGLKNRTPEITTDNLDWDISQGGLLNGVWVRWSEVEEPTEMEIEL